MNDLPRDKLCEIVNRRKAIAAKTGRDILSDPQLCRALLLDLCGKYRAEISVLVAALEERIVADLRTPKSGVPIALLLTGLVKRLVDNRALTEAAAHWAVRSWALALGIDVPPPRQAPVSLPESASSSRQRAALPQEFSYPSETPSTPPVSRPVKMTGNELVQRYEAGERCFRGIDVTGADLCGANLHRADLTEANLSEAGLKGVNLTGAYLDVANLRRADLRGAKLCGAYLVGADLSEADLRRTDLSGADLSLAKVIRKQLAKAKSLEGATMPDGTKHG
jgi:hypothetical protein